MRLTSLFHFLTHISSAHFISYELFWLFSLFFTPIRWVHSFTLFIHLLRTDTDTQISFAQIVTASNWKRKCCISSSSLSLTRRSPSASSVWSLTCLLSPALFSECPSLLSRSSLLSLTRVLVCVCVCVSVLPRWCLTFAATARRSWTWRRERWSSC